MLEFDPVTDFLNREQEALGELGPEINLAAQQAPDVFASESLEPQDNSGYVFLNGESKADGPSRIPPAVESDELGPSAGESQPPLGPDHGLENGMSSMHGNIDSVFGAAAEQTEAWRQAFNERIARKDAEEEKLIAELKETGEKELQNWYKHYQTQLENRTHERSESRKEAENGDVAEVNFKPTVQDKIVWEKVCSMCDFQAKQNAMSDMARMRSILLSLKPSTSS